MPKIVGKVLTHHERLPPSVPHEPLIMRSTRNCTAIRKTQILTFTKLTDLNFTGCWVTGWGSARRCLSCHQLLVYVTTKYIGLWKYQQKVDSRMLQSILRVLRSFTVNYLRMTQYWEKYVLTLFIKFHRCKNSKGNSTLLNDSKNVNYN